MTLTESKEESMYETFLTFAENSYCKPEGRDKVDLHAKNLESWDYCLLKHIRFGTRIAQKEHSS